MSKSLGEKDEEKGIQKEQRKSMWSESRWRERAPFKRECLHRVCRTWETWLAVTCTLRHLEHAAVLKDERNHPDRYIDLFRCIESGGTTQVVVFQ